MFKYSCCPIKSRNANSIQSRTTEPIDLQHPQHFLERQTIESLLKFSSISHLKLDVFLSTERVTNALINEMVSSWPLLRDLDLAIAYNTHLGSVIDIEGLCAFSQCRHLESLAVQIDVSSLDDSVLHTRTGSSMRCPTLKSLRPGCSAIRNPRAVAAVISEIFPNLPPGNLGFDAGIDRTVIPDYIERKKLWSECRTHLKWFATIRKQERTWSSRTELRN